MDDPFNNMPPAAKEAIKRTLRFYAERADAQIAAKLEEREAWRKEALKASKALRPKGSSS